MDISKKFQSNYIKSTSFDESHQNIKGYYATSKQLCDKTPIFLVGMMGAGKSTIGRSLAQYMDRKFIDLDYEIEAACGVKIPLIFEIEGESGFRKRESDFLKRYSLDERIVLATGGGAVLAPDNRQILKSRGIVVYLKAELDVLFKRTNSDHNRPLLATKDPYLKLQSLLELRDPMYHEVADIIIDTSFYNVIDIAKELVLMLKRNEKSI
ncbi:MAG: shikimate kinase [Candidatus Kinetoplastibacterium crithidii]|nr:MAG: shikimate kinase [Candidatus Kinetoplastibacterium crithidii]